MLQARFGAQDNLLRAQIGACGKSQGTCGFAGKKVAWRGNKPLRSFFRGLGQPCPKEAAKHSGGRMCERGLERGKCCLAVSLSGKREKNGYKRQMVLDCMPVCFMFDLLASHARLYHSPEGKAASKMLYSQTKRKRWQRGWKGLSWFSPAQRRNSGNSPHPPMPSSANRERP